MVLVPGPWCSWYTHVVQGPHAAQHAAAVLVLVDRSPLYVLKSSSVPGRPAGHVVVDGGCGGGGADGSGPVAAAVCAARFSGAAVIAAGATGTKSKACAGEGLSMHRVATTGHRVCGWSGAGAGSHASGTSFTTGTPGLMTPGGRHTSQAAL